MRSVILSLVCVSLGLLLSGCGDEYPDCNINTTSIVTEGRVSYDASTCDPNGIQEPLTQDQIDNLIFNNVNFDEDGPPDEDDAICLRNPGACEDSDS